SPTAECVTIILPYRGRKRPVLKVKIESETSYRHCLRLGWPDGRQDLLYWVPGLRRCLGKPADSAAVSWQPETALVASTVAAGRRPVILGCLETRPGF
ncbi:MAG TPA: hypothetical protein PKX93_03790, partial [bacterium]|nr:hypothetical protein [bacterium]